MAEVSCDSNQSMMRALHESPLTTLPLTSHQLIIATAARIGDIRKHGAAGGVAGAGAASLHLPGIVQKDLILQDFLNDDGHLVAALDLDQGTGSRVQGHHALLNQRRELETPSHLV